jgi:hypothetical protein
MMLMLPPPLLLLQLLQILDASLHLRACSTHPVLSPQNCIVQRFCFEIDTGIGNTWYRFAILHEQRKRQS